MRKPAGWWSIGSRSASAHKGPESPATPQIYASIGEKDLAFQWLDKAYDERNPLLAYAKVMPYYDNLRSDPRFRALLHRLGLGG